MRAQAAAPVLILEKNFMKSIFTRSAAALALALGLAACGGKAAFTVSGTVTGLLYPGLVLDNKGSDLPIAAGATTFSFPNTISYGDTYDVTVKINPLHQTCLPASADGSGHAIDTAGRMASISVAVTCSVNAFTVGGTVSGLTADGLVLTNGSSGGTVTLTNGTTAFTLPVAVTYGVTYGVTVLTQPTDGSVICSVSPNGTGVMGDAAVADIAVSCVPKS
jgi:hypothetical protein